MKNNFDQGNLNREKMASLKNLNQLLNADNHDKKKEILDKLDNSLSKKEKMKNLLQRLINSGEGLKYTLFSKWKAMPDPNNEHKAATKVEAKMQEMLKNSLNKGLKPLE